MCQTLLRMKALPLLFPHLDLNQYVVSDSKITLLESQDRKEVFHFFAPHQNEVLTVIYEKGTENGHAVLDIDSLYQISWKVVDGKPKGEYEVFKFCVCRCIGFINEDGSFDRHSYIECSSKSTMAVHCDPTTGVIVYRGGMGKTRFEREGFGAVYDSVSGDPLYFGLFHHNRLYRIYQKFVHGEFMVEYAYEDDPILLHSNQEGIARYLEDHPAQPEGTIVYRGGFKPQPCLFFMRSGEGCETRNGVTRYGIWRGERCIEQWSTRFDSVVFDCVKGFMVKSAREETPREREGGCEDVDGAVASRSMASAVVGQSIRKADAMADHASSADAFTSGSGVKSQNVAAPSSVNAKPAAAPSSVNAKPVAAPSSVPASTLGIGSPFIPRSSSFIPGGSKSSSTEAVPAPAPAPAPVSAPISAPISAPVSAPISAPVSAPVSAPANEPTPTSTIANASTPPPFIPNSSPFVPSNHPFVPSNSSSSVLPPKPNPSNNDNVSLFAARSEVVISEEMNHPSQSAVSALKKSHEQASQSPFVNGSTVLSESSLNSYFSNASQPNHSPCTSVDPFIPSFRPSGSQSLSKSNSQSSIHSSEGADKSQFKPAPKPFMNGFENSMTGPFIPGSSHASHFGSFIPSLRRNQSSPVSEQTQNPIDESANENDLIVSNLSRFQMIHDKIVTLTVTGNCCNEPECNCFDVSFCANLKSIRIADNCFQYVTKVSLKRMESLEELSIGANCFQGVQTRNESRCFCLEENDSLLTIKIGANSFVNYQEFVLRGELMHAWTESKIWRNLLRSN